MQRKIIEIKNCKKCDSNFEIRDKDLEFYDKVSPIFGGKKYQIPTPNFCPDCRQQRRLTFRNEKKLYKRKCDASGKNIISIYSPDKKNTVYNQEFRWSDKWDDMKFGIEINFNKSFFEQFNELNFAMLKRALIKGTGSENSDYVNGVGESKNCYLIFASIHNESCYFGDNITYSTNCVDCSFIKNSENCYELVDSANCYQVFFSQNCLDCSNSYFLFNCKGCSDCFGCVNLSNKKYYIFNKEYSKDEYKKEVTKLILGGYSLRDFNKFKIKLPNINLIIINSENAIGDKIYNSNDIFNSFEITDSNNINYTSIAYKNSSDVYDTYVCVNNSYNIYEGTIINKRCSNLIFCNDCWNECDNLIYCSECKTCKNCFGCAGLRDKEYCILNKQYSKNEYDELMSKIIGKMQKDGEWGEFFPSNISPFGYNETVAQEYFPLGKDVAMQHLYNWSDYETPLPKVDKVISASKLPENILDIPDDILNWAIMPDENVGNADLHSLQKPFRIIKGELEFYRKYNLPIPKRHPDHRNLDRMKQRNPRKLFDRKCDKCGKDIKTSYSSDREEIVYCEDCYNKEIY